jgi:hypothetical protein
MIITDIDEIQSIITKYCQGEPSLKSLCISLIIINNTLKSEKFNSLTDEVKTELFCKTTNSLLDKTINDTIDLKRKIKDVSLLSNLEISMFSGVEIAKISMNDFNYLNENTKSRILNLQTEVDQIFKSKCYIATMAYGDYDHPQVIILRQFRDEVLEHSVFGKWFIRKYYQISPKLVKRLKGNKIANYTIRLLLDKLVRFINNKLTK